MRIPSSPVLVLTAAALSTLSACSVTGNVATGTVDLAAKTTVEVVEAAGSVATAPIRAVGEQRATRREAKEAERKAAQPPALDPYNSYKPRAVDGGE